MARGRKLPIEMKQMIEAARALAEQRQQRLDEYKQAAAKRSITTPGRLYYNHPLLIPPTKPQGTPMPTIAFKFAPGDKVTVNRPADVNIWPGWRADMDAYHGQVFTIMKADHVLRQQANIYLTKELDSSVGLHEDWLTAYVERPKIDFETVVMPDDHRQQIKEALEQMHQYELIFEKWGFGKTMEKGRGISMLFHGPPGTGKTLTAQAIADHLGCTLKVIAAADIESSVPGEAERNIRKHFKEAKGQKVVLLFDECDSLIYSRQHVGAILGAQINELLSQLERFEGISIFTTNRLGTLDEAVNRRLALKLEFAMPTRDDRVKIWQRMFPAEAPLAKDVEWEILAEFEITGGYIKNAVLRAARMAATEKVANSRKKIAMKHLKKALANELQSKADFDAARDEHTGSYGRVVRRGGGGVEVARHE
jgi:ATP-dependent 26S proteasome regulatory subunit